MASFFVTGFPVGQARPRAYSRLINGRMIAGVYNPKEKSEWRARISLAAAGQIPAPQAGGVRLTLTFYLPRPKRLKANVIWHTKKPDLDNMAKAVLDALQGVLFMDDKQVFCLTLEKLYARDLSPCGVQIDWWGE